MDLATLAIKVDSVEAKLATLELEKLENQGKKTAASADLLETGFKKLMVVLGPAALAAGITAAVMGSVKLEESYVRLAEVAGTTSAMMSAMDLPARLAGTSLDTVATSIAKLSRSIGEARLGDVQKQGLFKALGIDFNDGRDAAEVLVDVGKSLTSMKDQNVAAAASTTLLSRGFAELRPFMKELTEQGELVATRTDEQNKRAKEFEDTLTKLGFRAQQTRLAFTEGLLPALQSIANVFMTLTSNQDTARVAGEKIGEALKYVAKIAIDSWAAVKMFVEEIGAMAAIGAAILGRDFKLVASIARDLDERITSIAARAEVLKGKLEAKPGEGGGGGHGAGSGAGGGSGSEDAVRALMEKQRMYEANVQNEKGFADRYAEAINIGNELAKEARKQGILDDAGLIQQLSANEDAKLQVLKKSLENQAKLHYDKGDKGKEAEALQAAEKVNAQIVGNQAITTARLTSLADQQSQDYKRDLEQRFAAVQAHFQAENDVVKNAFLERQNIIDIWRGDNEDRDEQWQALSAQNYADYEAEKTRIADEEAQKRFGIAKIHRDVDLASTKTFLGYMAGMMNSKNREMHEIGKAAAIGETIINTYAAAMGAYKALASIPYVGPALGAAAAAAAVVAGMAQVAAIRSTPFGGGGGAAPTFAASPTTGQPVGTPGGDVGIPQGGAAQAGTGHTFILQVKGGNSISLDSIDEVVDLINENTANGGRVIVERV